MKKTGKFLLGLAAIGAGIGAAVYYFTKNEESDDYEEYNDEFEDDFDLDNDLEPVGQRDYYSLNKTASTTETEMNEEPEATGEAKTESTDEANDTVTSEEDSKTEA